MLFRSIIILTCAELSAQGITISGRIVDNETLEPLPFTHVFIDQTTLVTVSDQNGEYKLEHVEDGDYKLVFSFVGYELYYKTVSVVGENLRVSARLVPTKELLESIEVKGSKDKTWENQLKQFQKVCDLLECLGRRESKLTTNILRYFLRLLCNLT